MRVYGRTTVHEFLGDFIVYRNLEPLDKRLPSLDDVREEANIPQDVTPRKTQPSYARAIVQLLQAARELDAPGTTLERLIYIGDTRMNDGIAFANVARAGDWTGLAFTASETDEPAPPEITTQGEGKLYLSNRWDAIGHFEQFCREQNFVIDAQTAVILDLDKTTFGARGRNDHVINQARVEAVRRTVGDLIGEAFDPAAFHNAYEELNQTAYHPFTADNQDYLAYVCLILASGLYEPDELTERVHSGEMTCFEQFIDEVDKCDGRIPSSLREIHEHIHALVQEGDPTPFKAFRYNEYHTTVERMGCLSDEASVQELLTKEIVITQEVRETALRWKAEGALLFGLSDKPDEASIPTYKSAARGHRSIHRVETHAVGTNSTGVTNWQNGIKAALTPVSTNPILLKLDRQRKFKSGYLFIPRGRSGI